MTSGIYEIVNLVTGKRYIGSAINIKERWEKHKYRLRNDNHHSIKLQRSWNKHGEDGFEFNILHECDKEQLLFCEQNWIEFYGIDNLYNICPTAGSNLGRKWSEEIKRKYQIANGGYPVIQVDMKGNILGRYESVWEAARETGIGNGNISKSVNKYCKCKNTMFVKSEDDIQFALQFALQKNREMYELRKTYGAINGIKNAKPVYQIDKETNQVIKKWDGTMDVERELGIYHSSISQCALEKTKSAGGYIWRYIEDTNYQIGDIYPL